MFGQWQPIETAPKDGTYIILYGSFARWGSPEKPFAWMTNWQQYETRGDASYEPAGDGLYRKVEAKRAGWSGEMNFVATHWMPMPDPPTVQPTAETEVPSNFVSSEASL